MYVRAWILLGLFGLGMLLPHGIVLIPIWLSYWVLRPFSARPAITGPRLALRR